MPGSIRLLVRAPSYEFSYNKKHLRTVMRAAGAEVARIARASIRGSGTGRIYRGTGGGSSAVFRGGYRKGRFQASVAGQTPAKVTGTLARSIRVKAFKSGEGVAIRDLAFYALMLEAGAQGGGGTRGARNPTTTRGGIRLRRGITGKRVLEARPFLTAALGVRQASIAQRIKASIRDDLAFEKRK